MQFEHQFNVCNESLYIKYDKYDLTIARLNDKEKTKRKKRNKTNRNEAKNQSKLDFDRFFASIFASYG